MPSDNTLNRRTLLKLLGLALCGPSWTPGAPTEAAAAPSSRRRVLGLDRVVAFTYLANARNLHSVTLTLAGPKDWKYWADRGVVPVFAHTWFDLLRNSSVDKASDLLAHSDYGGNPHPVVCIDEFGFDMGGHTDEHCAQILQATRKKRPDLGLAVWQMREPVPAVLGEAYRRYVDLVLPECYVGEPKNYWWIATQLHAARMHRILDKTVVCLGLGVGGNPGENWITSKDELERQLRFVRLIAPESPGVAFFGGDNVPEIVAAADDLCSRFWDLPSDGSGLPPEVLELHMTFSGHYDRPVIVCSPLWVEPDRDPTIDPNNLMNPKVMRVYLMNLGEKDAKNITVRLRNPKENGGNVFAEGVVSSMPRRGEAAAVLPVTAEWKVWKTWEMEIAAPGAEVITYTM